MNKTILLIGGNFSPELTGIGKYNGEMIDWLTNRGFMCTVITTFPYYPQWQVQEPYKKRSFWFKKEVKITSASPVKIIRCPHYIPRNPSGIKRFISDFSILASTSFALLPFLFSKKYEYVISVAPPFAIGLLGVFYKNVKNSKFLYHIQDLQIDAARDFNMIKSKTIINLLLSVECLILRNATTVSTISPGMVKRIKEKCKKDIVHFPNWVDLEEYFPIDNKEDLKLDFGFSPNDKIVLYSGAIGEKQGLETIIYAAKFFEKDAHIKFVICGHGPYKHHLLNLKEKLNLGNVIFLPLQPASKFNSFLNMADIHLVLQKANASDLFLPSKLSAILAIGGLAIVTADKHSSLFEIMHSSHMGIVIEPENQSLFNNAISNGINTDHTQNRINARSYAERCLSMDSILVSYAEKALNYKEVLGPGILKQIHHETANVMNA